MTTPPSPDFRAAPRIDAIHLAAAARGPVRAVPEATAVPGRGLLGDRYERGAGTFSDWPKDHELTLVEAEVIEDLARTHGVHFAPGEHRRNVTTRNVRLNDLVGRRFRLGPDVECEGTRLCPPCDHLEAVTARPTLCRLMAGRGGLRARIVTGGTIRAGDLITLLPPRYAVQSPDAYAIAAARSQDARTT